LWENGKTIPKDILEVVDLIMKALVKPVCSI